jgi:hypothetical protein
VRVTRRKNIPESRYCRYDRRHSSKPRGDPTVENWLDRHEMDNIRPNALHHSQDLKKCPYFAKWISPTPRKAKWMMREPLRADNCHFRAGGRGDMNVKAGVSRGQSHGQAVRHEESRVVHDQQQSLALEQLFQVGLRATAKLLTSKS